MYGQLQEADFRGAASPLACRDASYLLKALVRLSKKQDEWRAAVLVMLLLHRKRRWEWWVRLSRVQVRGREAGLAVAGQAVRCCWVSG